MLSTVAKYFLPLAALGLLVFAFVYVFNGNPASAPAATPPPLPPAISPFTGTVAAAGVVEAETENISVGSPLSGIVVKVFVTQDDLVQPGDPLFSLDDRQMQAELTARKAQLATARAELLRYESEPRPEKIPVNEAMLAEAQATVARALDRLNRVKQLVETGAATPEEYVQAQQLYRSTFATQERAAAELALLKKGAWELEIDVAKAQVAQAEAQVKIVETEIERLVVRALVQGRVLQINVRPGEFVNTMQQGDPLIILGSTANLHVRVDIDEYDIPRFHADTPAIATLKGNPKITFPLKFVRIEPYVVPKRSLTGDNSERVDTRVLQVIYAIEHGSSQLYVGQQVDVFIDAPTKAK